MSGSIAALMSAQTPAAGGLYSVTDDFTRADNPVGDGTNYTGMAGGAFLSAINLFIASTVVSTYSFVQNGAIVAPAKHTFAANQRATITIVANLTGGAQAHALARMTAAGSGYSASTDGTTGSGHSSIVKWTAGTPAEIKAVATTFTAGDTIGCECVGTTIKMLKNGSVIDSVTDATFATGQPGLSVSNQNDPVLTIDHLVAEEV